MRLWGAPEVFNVRGLPAELRRAIVADARARGIRISLKVTRLRKPEEEEE